MRNLKHARPLLRISRVGVGQVLAGALGLYSGFLELQGRFGHTSDAGKIVELSTLQTPALPRRAVARDPVSIHVIFFKLGPLDGLQIPMCPHVH
jgi:hypothetical protein